MYDIVIIGGGPAGLSAGIYAARGGMNALLIENMVVGGQITKTMAVDNYPGFPDGIDGFAIGANMEKQAKRFGLEISHATVGSVMLEGEVKRMECGDGTIESRTVIIATGASPKKLGLPNEAELTGAGVSYCATCDGAFFKNASVAVVGGGDTALGDALYLARFASRVYLIHRRDKLRGTEALQRAVFAEQKIQFLPNTVVTELLGDGELSGLMIKDLAAGSVKMVDIDGLFVAVGVIPNNCLFKGKLQMNEQGSIVTDKYMKTSVDGVYAAGDVRDTPLRQVVTAAADGAVAATAAMEYITK